MKTVLDITAIIIAAVMAEFIPIAIIDGALSIPMGILLIVSVIAAVGGSAYFAVRDYKEKHLA